MNTDTPTPRTNKAFLDGYTFCKEDMMPAVAFASQLERELKAVTDQRDRLAEALTRIAQNGVQDLPETNYAYAFGRMEGIAKIALQSLTTNPPTSEKI